LPNSLNAAKRQRQNITRRNRNKSTKSAVRTSIKAFEQSIKQQDKVAAVSHFNSFVKLIDTATGKGVYHKNSAARKKSRLYKILSTMEK